MVFMELDRKEDVLASVKGLVEEIQRLTGSLDWQVSTTLSEEQIPLSDDTLMQYIQVDPENYLTKEEFMAQKLEAEQKEEEHRLEEQAQDNSNRILEFLKPSSILEAGITDTMLHIRGSRDVASLEIVNFGHGPDVMSEMGISESAIKTDYDKVSFAKLNAMLGEMKALPINEYIVIYNPAHKDVLIAKAS
jgi:hypothetical protein